MRQHCDAARRGAETPTKQASDSTPDSTRANQGSDALPAKPTTHSSQLKGKPVSVVCGDEWTNCRHTTGVASSNCWFQNRTHFRRIRGSSMASGRCLTAFWPMQTIVTAVCIVPTAGASVWLDVVVGLMGRWR